MAPHKSRYYIAKPDSSIAITPSSLPTALKTDRRTDRGLCVCMLAGVPERASGLRLVASVASCPRYQQHARLIQCAAPTIFCGASCPPNREGLLTPLFGVCSTRLCFSRPLQQHDPAVVPRGPSGGCAGRARG